MKHTKEDIEKLIAESGQVNEEKLNEVDEENFTPLTFAASNPFGTEFFSDLKAIANILKYKGYENYINQKDGKGRTALSCAVENALKLNVDYLIKLGADKEQKAYSPLLQKKEVRAYKIAKTQHFFSIQETVKTPKDEQKKQEKENQEKGIKRGSASVDVSLKSSSVNVDESSLSKKYKTV